MVITRFNNWKTDNEFIAIEISQKYKDNCFVFTFCILGFGICLISPNNKTKE